MNANKSFQFSAAVRGFHIFQKTWHPVTNEMLKCAHESGNEYDPFSIKTCQIENGSKTVGHLPKEITRATKFLLDRGATISLKLSSDHYRRSPLFQGGLEIPCIMTVTMAGTARNHMVLNRCKEIVNRLYCEPKNEVIIGCFLAKNKDVDTVALDNEVTVPKKKKKKTPKSHESIPKSRDIRQLFFMQNRKNMETSTVVID